MRRAANLTTEPPHPVPRGETTSSRSAGETKEELAVREQTSTAVRETRTPVPPASSSSALLRMRRQRTRDTKPEIALRQELHAAGLRYRVDEAPLAGSTRRADILFRRQRLAVFVDGCFWHGCPDHFSGTLANSDFWAAKIAANRVRDQDTDRQLIAAGWRVLRLWEHSNSRQAAEIVRRWLDAEG